MARSLTGTAEADIQADHVIAAFFVSIETEDGTLRLWSGTGAKSWSGETWTGVGDLGAISPIPETSETQAEGIQLTLAGIDSGLIGSVLSDARQGLPVFIWLATMDATGAISGSGVAFEGDLDVPTIESTGNTSTISITAESKMIRLRHENPRRYTSEDQQLDYPGDLGFEFVAQSTQYTSFGGDSIPAIKDRRR